MKYRNHNIIKKYCPKANYRKPVRIRHAFTFIELMIAITLMAMAFFPVMSLFTTAIEHINLTSEMSTSLNLGREGMEMIRNLNLPVETLNEYPSYYYPPLKEEPILLNHKKWRIFTRIHKGTRPLQVDIQVISEPTKEVTLVLTTLFEDLFL